MRLISSSGDRRLKNTFLFICCRDDAPLDLWSSREEQWLYRMRCLYFRTKSWKIWWLASHEPFFTWCKYEFIGDRSSRMRGRGDSHRPFIREFFTQSDHALREKDRQLSFPHGRSSPFCQLLLKQVRRVRCLLIFVQRSKGPCCVMAFGGMLASFVQKPEKKSSMGSESFNS